MERVDQVVDARWIIPVEPAGVVLTDHSVVINDGLIIDVLKTPTVERSYLPADRVALPEQALIPGLVNAHTHAAMTLLRGYADDLPLAVWLRDHIWPAESEWVTPDFVWDGTSLAVSEMLSAGVTCFADMYFFPEVGAQVAEQFGIRMVAGLICFDNETNYSMNAQECIDKGLVLHDELMGSKLVTTAWAPHAPYTVSDGPLAQIAVLAEKLGIPVHTHVNETSDEAVESVERYGLSQMRRLSGLGLVNERLVAAHMVHPTDDDIELMSANGTHVVHCPESNLKLANGFCPVHSLLEADINVALGTDGAASNNDLDLIAEMRIAALLGKGVAKDASAVPASQALHLATLGGARALGLANRIGSLVAGKSADMVAVRLDEWANQPIYDPISQLVYTANRSQVSDVWVGGQRRVRDGQLLDVDSTKLHKSAADWALRIGTPAI